MNTKTDLDQSSITENIRDNRGLLRNFPYVFHEDGRVNYRALLKPEHLYFNKDKLEEIKEKYGKSYEKIPIVDIEDKYLLITLAGINYLANVRGFTEVSPKVDFVSEQRCVVSTQISWIPNFETNFLPVKYGQVGSASIYNTHSWTQNYLEAIAANRAFVRSVRFFLGLSIVGADEVGPNNIRVAPTNETDREADGPLISPNFALQRKIEGKNISFTKYKEVVNKKYSSQLESNPQEWTSYESIPKKDACLLLELHSKAES